MGHISYSQPSWTTTLSLPYCRMRVLTVTIAVGVLAVMVAGVVAAVGKNRAVGMRYRHKRYTGFCAVMAHPLLQLWGKLWWKLWTATGHICCKSQCWSLS
jgi:hypothetical protein